MPLTLIDSFPKEKRTPKGTGAIINVAELFCNTIQGENWTGVPATFLRVQKCSLACFWCDSLEVWKKGNPYNVSEILDMFEENKMIEKFVKGQHLILTGGSPLLQQDALVELIKTFETRFGFKPYIEVENEAVITPSEGMIEIVDCWNNSPKLTNSGMKEELRHKPEEIRLLANLNNSWFKFVVSSEEDWEEIDKTFIQTNLIKREQIVLMPEGKDRAELQVHYGTVVDICVRESIRFSDRLHISIWNKQCGV